MARSRGIDLFGASLAGQATRTALRGLDPRVLTANPVMLVIEVAAVLTTVLAARSLLVGDPALAAFTGQVAVWLWLTVFLASFAEAMAEARGKARAGRLRALGDEVPAKLLVLPQNANLSWVYETVSSHALRAGASCSSRRGMSSRRMAKSSMASPRSTNPPSPVSRRP